MADLTDFKTVLKILIELKWRKSRKCVNKMEISKETKNILQLKSTITKI